MGWEKAILTFTAVSAISHLHVTFSATVNVSDLEPQYILRNHVTVSGFESGGIMAQMLQIAYSTFFKGVATFSSTYYRCGPPSDSLKEFNRLCTKLSNTNEDHLYDIENVYKEIAEYMKTGVIEDVKNLRNKRLYVYAGLRSSMFSLVQSLRTVTLWEKYIRNPYNIKSKIQDANFVMPTDTHYGDNCTADATLNHFIANCGFSGAFEALKFLYADSFTIHHPNSKELQRVLQPLRSFNQTAILKGLSNHQMDEVGFYYVPTRCLIPNYPCLLHVFFHGCGTSRVQSGKNFIGNSGFMEVAEKNDIIMLFPQSSLPKCRKLFKDKNGKGCWDHFGLGGSLYATKKGTQMTAVWKIIQRILGGLPPSNPINEDLDQNSPSSPRPETQHSQHLRTKFHYHYVKKPKISRQGTVFDYGMI